MGNPYSSEEMTFCSRETLAICFKGLLIYVVVCLFIYLFPAALSCTPASPCSKSRKTLSIYF